MESLRHAGRDLVIGLVGAGALVALVLGHVLLGVVLGVAAVWALVAAARGRPVLSVDQRAADREGQPTVRG